jgi:hypothetical protein
MSNPFQPPNKPPGNGAKKERKPPVPPPVDPMAGKSVWMKCRARAGCEGNSCVYQMRFRLPAGGQSIRYRCATCGGSFHITY